MLTLLSFFLVFIQANRCRPHQLHGLPRPHERRPIPPGGGVSPGRPCQDGGAHGGAEAGAAGALPGNIWLKKNNGFFKNTKVFAALQLTFSLKYMGEIRFSTYDKRECFFHPSKRFFATKFNILHGKQPVSPFPPLRPFSATSGLTTPTCSPSSTPGRPRLRRTSPGRGRGPRGGWWGT